MAEKTSKSRTEKVETEEKLTGDVTTAVSTPDDKTEGLEETGYGSAQGSSDVMSGAESSVWTSDDRGPEEAKTQESLTTRPQDAVPEGTSSGVHIATKPAAAIKKPSKKPKLALLKKASPISKHVASATDLTESLIPVEEDKTSPHRTRSKSKLTSGLPRLVSLRKTRTTEKSQSCSPTKQAKGAKSTPKKSPVKKLSSGIPTSTTPKKQRLTVPLPDEEPEPSTQKEMTTKSPRSPKKTSLSKAKSSVQETSVQGKPSEVTSKAAESEKAGECPVKPKKSTKFMMGKLKTSKKVSTVETQLAKPSSSSDVKHDAPSASKAFALVRKGIKKMDVSGKIRRNSKGTEETCLLEKDEKDERTKSAKGEDESSEDRSLNEPYRFKESSWKPKNEAQQGGFLDEEMICCLSSSEKDTTPTEMSTLSDSPCFVRARSKSQRSRHRTLDSMSRVSSLGEEEDVEGTAGTEGDARPQLQRQGNVLDVEMEAESGDVFSSPEHKATPKKDSEDETKE